MKFQEVVDVNGKTFKLVKQRREAPMAVYRYDSLFMRVGKREDLVKEMKERDKLKSYGFPIPNRYKKAKTENGLHYYLEESMGRRHFTQIFGAQYKESGKIGEKDFKDFIGTVKKFAIAQLKTSVKKKDFKEFTSATRIRKLEKIFPSHKNKIRVIYEEAKEKLSVFPFVLTHGDFNTHNLYRKGVIDFEGLFYAPAGYDIVSAIFTTEMMELRGNDLPIRFSEEEKKQYYDAMDKLYLENGLPRVSDYAKYFEFCRAAWLTANTNASEHAQKYRRKYFVSHFLNQDLRKSKTAL